MIVMTGGIFDTKKGFFTMKTFVFVFLLISFISQNDSTILASKGYIASMSPVRNLLISSGLGYLIRDSAATLYDKSDFRSVSDQGTKVRRAIMKNYTLTEVGLDGSFRQRKGENWFSGKAALKEKRTNSERLFGVLKTMDKNTCISKLLCEIGANPLSFGAIGFKINSNIKSVPPVTWNSETFPYIEAFQAGSREGVDACRFYKDCTYDLHRIVYFLWSFINPIHL